MKKMRLDPDALMVESFEVTQADRQMGTVHGAQGTLYDCPSNASPSACYTNCDSCWASCPMLTKCQRTCDGGNTCQYQTCGCGGGTYGAELCPWPGAGDSDQRCSGDTQCGFYTQVAGGVAG